VYGVARLTRLCAKIVRLCGKGSDTSFNWWLLIYMSIQDSLQRAVARGELAYLPMRLDSDPIERAMLLDDEVKELLSGPFRDIHHERRIGRLHADLETFVTGGEVSLCFTHHRHGKAYLGLLDPPGQATWDIRSRNPGPGLRVFGRFAATNIFVALTWRPRSKHVAWSSKDPLADDNLLWRIAIHDCEEKWNRILPGEVPVAGTRAENYVSDHFIVV
jgi:hypothetical protein